MSSDELTKLRSVYKTGLALRMTEPVDDEFPLMMHSFDTALTEAKDHVNADIDIRLGALAIDQFDWVERMGWHKNKTVLEALALIASEVGQAVNECRGEKPTQNFSFELADIILRTLDLAEWQGIDIQETIRLKMNANFSNGTKGKIK